MRSSFSELLFASLPLSKVLHELVRTNGGESFELCIYIYFVQKNVFGRDIKLL